MKNRGWVIGGILAVLVGMGLIMPVVAELRMSGSLPTIGVGLLLAGIVLTLAGGTMTFTGMRSPRG